ncbi:MAG TPA: hypothetical protein VFE47_20955 [Tepidisphaeraceae bacterium]|jgi:hypothetical protein|nr:hypothetical protein [Tepidisphaeraceae bacterium]
MATATVGEITESKIPDVADFLARQVPPGEAKAAAPPPPRERLAWLLLENPARAADIPFGWRIIDNGGAIAGAAICTPFHISSGGIRFTALMFSKFYVDLPYRSMGLGLLMRFIKLGSRYPLFCTSTNAVAGAMFKKVGAAKIDRLDHTMLGICRLQPVAEEWIYRKIAVRAAARMLSLPAALGRGRIAGLLKDSCGGELEPLSSAGELGSWQPPTVEGVTAVVRDRDYLAWRYFSRERGKDAFIFRFAGEAERFVAVNEVRAGYRGQIRVLNVLDVWPPTTAGSATALCAQLSLRYQGRFDTIWLRSQSPAAEEALADAGFARHMFPAPLGWYIDRENKLPAKDWCVMPGESE